MVDYKLKLKLNPAYFSEIKNKIKLILLGISSLGIEEVATLNMPNNQEELNKLVIKIVEIARKNKELIRRACGLLEGMKQRNESLDSYGIVKEYWENFRAEYRQTFSKKSDVSEEKMEDLAIYILFNMLFYTGAMGEHRLHQELNTAELF